MKCSQCGSELKEGNLYCEKCGYEIQIVPDFEPELENSIEEALNTMAGDFAPPPKKKENKSKQKPKAVYALPIAGGGILALIIIWLSVISYRNHSYDYQIKKAVSYAANENYEQAVAYLSKAVLMEEADCEARLLMADYYTAAGEEKKAIAVLREIIAIDAENTEGYGRLIDLYKKNEDYEAINRLLLASDSAAVLEKYNEYAALPPEFESPEGSYQEIVPLKLSANTQGTIYYTLDGTKADTSGIRYTAPFLLEAGDYSINAVFINNYGVASENVTKQYHIDVAQPLAPEVEPISGAYSKPTVISAEAPVSCTVYYTLDGSEPTENSIPYAVPIAMPMGNSCFKFIAYNEEGIAGEVTTRNYILKVNTAIQPTDAVNLLLKGLKEREVIAEYDGSVAGKSGKNSYIASTLIDIGGNSIYLVVEYYTDALGTLTKTGLMYGVNSETGVLYKVTVDNMGNYSANPI